LKINLPALSKYYWYDPVVAPVVKSSIEKSKNLYLYGPTGCGKTSIVENICNELGRKYLPINFNEEISADDFYGVYSLKNGNTVFEDGFLLTAMKNGYVLLIDEFDVAPPEILFVLQRVLEHKSLVIPKINQVIQPSPNFCIVATANTYGKGDWTTLYQGVRSQNEATYDRWDYVVSMDYPPKEAESKILSTVTGVTTVWADKISELAFLVRQSDSKVYSTFSTRRCISLANAYLDLKDIWLALKVTVFDRVSYEDGRYIYEIASRIFDVTANSNKLFEKFVRNV